jgi:serine beta-lactamase-like protein LACTB, mitochondrial
VGRSFRNHPVPHAFYSKSKSGEVRNSGFLDASNKIPGGGWLSSADDMAKFEIAVLSDRLIQRSTRDVMWTTQTPAPEGSEKDHRGYGLGWGTGTVNGVAVYEHSGGQQGTSTLIMLAPDRNAGVVVLINMDNVDAPELGTTLMKTLLSPVPSGP